MASKLQCEICGGKLVGKPGGIFECENCGTEYSTEWARAKIQEITGTVKVEGTVEVAGKVQVEGPVQVDSSANKEALLKRGYLSLEDEDWDKAEELFDQVLNMDAQNAEAYLGLAMAELTCENREALQKRYTEPGSNCRANKELARARKFGAEGMRNWFKQLDREAEENKRREERLFEESAKRRERIAGCQGILSAGREHIVGLKADGTVVAAGGNYYGQCNVSGWKDIVAVSAGSFHTVGLRADGTVAAVGNNKSGQCNVSDWKDIVAVSAGFQHTVGLRSDGTVVAVGYDLYYQCNVSYWRDIVAVSAGGIHTVGLRSDGTVVAVGYELYGRCNVSYWRDIVAVSAGGIHTVGLRADGTVAAVGDNTSGQCDVSDWKDIVAVSAGDHTVGLRADGTVVAVGKNDSGQCNVSGWKLFESIDTLADERKAAKEKAEAERKAAEEKRRLAAERAEAERKAHKDRLKKESTDLHVELANLKGLFTGKRRKEIEARLAQIETELKKLG